MSTDLIVGFFTLTALEIVLGIDNLVFISILAGKLPEHQRARARQIGIALALVGRLVLLASITLIMRLTVPLFTVAGIEFTGQSIILLAGGLFLIGKATYEIHESLEGEEDHKGSKVRAAFGAVLLQIVALDLVFSLDSVITAVGMIGDEPGGIWVMVAAVVIAVVVMLVSAGPLSRFVNSHPTVKMLALSFLLLIGFTLVAEGLHFHVPRGYIYFAMGFSLFVELLNIFARRRRKAQPVKLNSRYADTSSDAGAPAAASAGAGSDTPADPSGPAAGTDPSPAAAATPSPAGPGGSGHSDGGSGGSDGGGGGGGD
ncbi:TerC family protein [Streptomonospora nanhaiensis]|uniref:Putative tellurium resistance membrane protein TerC n=1 Tax=Streptomonospora nanhaiensis TaxID=1323731 RepID=A0A853BWF1_9ACTN|nr:TerC family protein [Streptomonospora nanhaiensis]MBV2364853.1 TerC family protein [Streptomonospora nanhaiensis]MBX9387179.1 TerC family protein [Streptomonospora nanhaiensis]NYI98797.1 putative tellurium resistance membrane protein TerC [Streptomonospora nanhaiensis]